MSATIHLTGVDVRCHAADCQPQETRLDGDTLKPRFEAWAKRYEAAVRKGRPDDLYAIGREMFDAFDGNGWASAWVAAPGVRALEIQVDDPRPELAAALLDAPWELLAHKHGYLAEDRSQMFEVLRRIGKPRTPVAPRYGDLKLLFMAAAPEGEHELDFEAEEAAILEATAPKGVGTRRLHLIVEETGAIGPLRERMLDSGEPCEVLHLSCHGQIDPQRGPYLALEHPEGGTSYVPAYASDIVHVLPDCDRTPLVFLSACRTAERADQAASLMRSTGDAPRPLEPFVRELVRAGIHNALGWDGSVYDPDAKAFAQYLYGELAAFRTLPQAVAYARTELLRLHRADAQHGQHWHLARLYVGPGGGGALALNNGPRRSLPNALPRDRFLDKARTLVPVAGRQEFVGRRRSLQQVLRAFGRGSAGVLVQGMGNLGKSSLAARIRDRMTGHTPVVIFRQYDAL
ncbi:MAG TPA: CHAT domain-containing protein, partial [Tahibacter sp.]|nr:CHAT domain-containing protein [Tahibacter sp.]